MVCKRTLMVGEETMDAAELIGYLSPTKPRRLRVIENILIGKRTVSTLYWGMRYHQLAWLGYDKQLTRQTMDGHVERLVHDGLLSVTDTNAVLTKKGAERQQVLRQTRYQPKALPVRLTVDLDTFWQRFLLATQVVSEQSYQTRKYYPLQVAWPVKQMIKKWYQQFYSADLSAEFNAVLTRFLKQLAVREATFFSRLLVGHDRPGETLLQLAQQNGLSSSEAHLMLTDLACQFVHFLRAQSDSSVKALLAGLSRQPISESALNTLNRFQAGQALEEIGHQRRLKVSTVKEHLLEAAIMLPVDQFPYEKLLTPQLQNELSDQFATQNLDDWQFNQLSNTQVAFWQFRLFEILRSKQTDDQQ
ncbi:hypothetical protein GM612_00875 [Lactobacillus sp. CRM56-3]|uniref:Helicase Helix-turn-helix domain-containing protein n=1 Tax=Secundilactobacillus folii TaxID=2678357 RepID=A0A7X2XUA0_9LACO|nr:hypothetical protein [Secundilactobacillus folii]